jgi:two-component sensor histidine kinase
MTQMWNPTHPTLRAGLPDETKIEMPSDGGGTPEARLAVQLDELRHRLRNHLQNMTSLISLQIRRARHPETVEALEDLRVRFATLTSVYVDLDNASDHPIALDRFIPDLVRRVGELYDPKAHHRASFDMASVALPQRRAAVLGQIVVELVMNIHRHAFAGWSDGDIDVALAVEGDHAVLVISDNGPGMREPDPGRVHLGFRIVSNLSTALGGTFESMSQDGFSARVRFPLDASGSAPG